MSFQYTDDDVRVLCGRFAFEEGESIWQAGGVTILRYDPAKPFCEANVRTNRDWIVTAAVSRGEIVATCTCPDFDPEDKYCEHVAAMLLHLLELPELPEEALNLARISASDQLLSSSILDLFSSREHQQTALLGSTRYVRDTRIPVEVQFSCVIFSSGYRNYRIGIELRLGLGRLYVVPDIRAFIEGMTLNVTRTFSKQFTFNPAEHRFLTQDHAMLAELARISRNEALYQEDALPKAGRARGKHSDRMLMIPPADWPHVLPLLLACPSVLIDQEGTVTAGLQMSEQISPVRFEFGEHDGNGFQLDVEGLDKIVVLTAYNMVLSEGRMMPLPEASCRQLADFKNMLDASRRQHVIIAPEQIEPFMDKVVPELMKLGQVQVTRSVSEKIVQTPLTARLYLDRIRDRLLAELEFQYGDIRMNPLAANHDYKSTDRILLRDGERENQILDIMEQSGFVTTELGYYMQDEDSEYEFLRHTISKLEKLLQVHATSAVKTRIVVPNTPPILKVEVDERTNWLDFRFELTGISDDEIREVLRAIVEKRRYYRLQEGALLPLEGKEYEAITRIINETGFLRTELNHAAFRIPLARGLHLADFDNEGRTIQLGKSFRKLLAHIRNPDHLEFEVPASLQHVLRDYQKYGFQWMKTLAHYRFGGILADDMGLGKTVQSITFLLSFLPEIRRLDQPAIIVAPASLMYNWLSELKKFAPEMRVVIADGTRPERAAKLRSLQEMDVIITSYPLLRRDIELYVTRYYHTVILDEAQAFKNHATQTAQAVKALQAKYRFGLTGTPLENKVEELWSLFGAIFPELFPARKVFSDLPRENIARRARPFLLRRLKSDVLKELPEKIETLQATNLLPEQKKLYVSYLAKLRTETVKHLDNDRSFHQNRIKILAGLTRLRQICCHPALFVTDYEGSSAKFEQLFEIVEECRSTGKRMLIFSQFTEMLGLISKELVRQGLSYFYLDGSTKASERVELCNRFNDGEKDIFLASLKAGGTGLNLTGADTVILYDLWWNPAVEQQAADRAHRIGQTKVVQVIRLAAHGTVEDKMYALQQRKKNMIDDIIQPGEEQLSSLTEADIREILAIGADERDL
ncbi:DEAD/DEAH box helicase [Paenibacillus glycanilyticus]|uniref:DEAD/DEAH box helicase n=1 Tax=Paenibacillus glycanilyticus TaxID=126569 RepID=UPI00203BCD2D|nr:DEAD/DEAH box helicase [Paenibacillus glycanilyticus]MCM3626968.1 DEAD/DEAH box helicase [Paenibacillus glycanilyticus]